MIGRVIHIMMEVTCNINWLQIDTGNNVLMALLSFYRIIIFILFMMQGHRFTKDKISRYWMMDQVMQGRRFRKDKILRYWMMDQERARLHKSWLITIIYTKCILQEYASKYYRNMLQSNESFINFKWTPCQDISF